MPDGQAHYRSDSSLSPCLDHHLVNQPDIGSEQSQKIYGSSPVRSQKALPTVKDRKKPGLKVDIGTSKYSSYSKAQSDLVRSEEFSTAIGKAREALRQMRTSGRMTPESPTRSLNSVLSRSNAIRKPTGKSSGEVPKKVCSTNFR